MQYSQLGRTAVTSQGTQRRVRPTIVFMFFLGLIPPRAFKEPALPNSSHNHAVGMFVLIGLYTLHLFGCSA